MNITLIYISLIICTILFILNFYFNIYRNYKVYYLALEMNNIYYRICSNNIDKKDGKMLFNIWKKETASYSKMMYSFKPLTLEQWLHKEFLIRLENKRY